MHNLISISGLIGSGKDTVGKIIALLNEDPDMNDAQIIYALSRHQPHLYEFQIKKWAWKLKQVAGIMLDMDPWRFEEQEIKELQLASMWNSADGTPMTIRDFLQKLGTDAIRTGLHTNAWVNALMTDYDKEYKWIITDTRFPNELAAIEKEGGLTLLVTRKGAVAATNTHESETALKDAKFDVYINNDGNLAELVVQVRGLCDEYILNFKH
jgi:hypothetical protein